MRSILFTCILLSPLVSLSQDWQSVYKEAVAAYQAGDYLKAMAPAEKAIALAQTLDRKSQAYSVQIFTASCLESDQPEKGLSLIDKEIEHFKILEPSGKNYQEALSKKGKLLLAFSKPADAAVVFHETAVLKEKTFGKSSYEYYRALADEGEALIQAKQYPEAQRLYDVALPGFKTLPDAGEDYLYALFHSAFIDHALNNNTVASKKLTDFIALAEQNNLQQLSEYESARKMLSSINSTGESSSAFMLGDDKAKKLLQQALASQGKNPKESLSQYAACVETIVQNNLVNNTSFSCYLNYARFLYSVNDVSKAALMASSAKTHGLKLFAANSTEIGHVQVLEADIALKSGKKSEALALYRQAIENLKSEKPEILAKQTRWIGEQLIQYSMDDEAIALLAVIIKDASFANFTLRDKILIHKLNGTAYLEARETEQLLKDVGSRLTVEKDPDLSQTFLFLIAKANRESGNWNTAVDNLIKALQLNSAGIIRGELYYELARLQQEHGDFKEAELNYGKAVENIAASVSPTTLGPQVYNSFATFYIEMGNYEAAEKLFLGLLKNEKDNGHFFNAVRQNLAAMYEQTGKYDKAKRLLISTMKSDRILLGESHPDYAITLQNLAAVYQKTGKLDSAQLLYEQALAIDKKHYGEESLAYATKLANLAAVYQELLNFQKARLMLEQSLAIRKKLLNADHPDYAYNLYNLGFLLYRTRQPREALPYFQQASVYYLKQIKDVFPVLSDYERTAFYNKIQEVIRGYEMFLIENAGMQEALVGDLLNFRLETKALLLSSSIKVRNQILQSANAELISKFAVWQHTKEQLAFLFSLSQAEREENIELIEEYTKTANDLEKWLSVQSEAFGSSYAQPSADWKRVQASLKPGEAAMEILRVKLPYKDSVVYAALLLKPDGKQPAIITLPNGRGLEGRLFRRYINGIRFQDEDHISYGNYWKKLDSSLKDVKLVYMSPDGVFNKINCLTLFDPSTNQYVIDRLRIRVVSNLKELLSRDQQHTSTSTAVLLGFPDYRMGSPKASDNVKGETRSADPFFELVQGGISDLPATGDEVTKIRSALEGGQWKVQLFTRDQALEEKVKALENPGILHIATHGFFIPQQQENTRQVSGNELSNIANNVMLRSGLLLAGAEKNLRDKISGQSKNQSEDGVLTAYEVLNLNLDKSDLVVLSACETGTGDIRNGEGVYGLQRAFMLAGAKCLIMSLWKVDDSATQELMTGFYSSWTKGADKANAFYDAQLSIKKKYSLPFYWGAFVVVGNL